MRRFLVTGTDTDVGKTRVAAALARALQLGGERVTIVKLVQTGEGEDAADARRAGELAGCASIEAARFRKAADPWSAALAEGTPPVHAEDLAHVLSGIDGSVVAEGAGGLAVPLNRTQDFADVAQLGGFEIVVTVGLRLGCLNHALLTLSLCTQRSLDVAGAVLVDRWEASEPQYLDDVRRTLQGKTRILGILPFDVDEPAAVETGGRAIAEAL